MREPNPRGSTWNKWDLHVHSPFSIYQNYGADDDEAWERFIGDLEKLPVEFKVVGINDYIFVDGYERVLKAKTEQGRLQNLDLILPVIELRLDKFGGVVKKGADGSYTKSDLSRINVHVIFDQLEPEVIRQQFIGALKGQGYDLIPEASAHRGKWKAVITRDSLRQLGEKIIDTVPEAERARFGTPAQEGFNNLCISFEKIKEVLGGHELVDRHILAIGKTEWEDLKWNDQSIAEKKNLINGVSLVFTAAANPEAYHKSKERLVAEGVNSKLLDCSDAHALSSSTDKDRIGNCFTWIKAEPTFEGLKQAITEFEQRIFIGDTPEKLLLVERNRTKYASTIRITRKSAAVHADTWFDVNVPLSHDLVAIIGNKGSGKSALSDAIALVGNTKNFESFSFLTANRFRDPKNNLASHYEGSLQWHDGTEVNRDLSDDPNPANVERIKYLPQSYLENLCNELAGSGSSTFDAELRKIIFTHVPDEERIGCSSLDELLDFKVAELDKEREQRVKTLSSVNMAIAQAEHRMAPRFRQSLLERVNGKRQELKALEAARPATVEDPAAGAEAQKEAAEAQKQVEELEAKLKLLRSAEQDAKNKKAEAARKSARITRILQAIRNHQSAHVQFLKDIEQQLNEVPLSIPPAELISISVNLVPLESSLTLLKKEIDLQDAALSGAGDETLTKRIEISEAELKRIKGLLGEKQRLFLVYKEQLAQWERAKAELHGDEGKKDTIVALEAEIRSLDLIPAQLKKLKGERRVIVREIHAQISKAVEEYRTLYQPVQGFVQSIPRLDMSLPLSFNVRIAEDRFQEEFLGRINRQVRGTFSGVDESNVLLKRTLQETDFSDVENVIAFVEKIDDMLHFDRRGEGTPPAAVLIPDQMRRGNLLEDVYDHLFGLSYLSPQYSLTYDGQEISRLSPGERGLLLLVFYLLVDKDDIPLVIDQPEENLDNQTIYKVLVSCIKTAKTRRQVIMVTHNPNLAVVCDAEQIIWAECDKKTKRFSYKSGAIESPAIRDRVVDILEGTAPAFLNRQRKYSIGKVL